MRCLSEVEQERLIDALPEKYRALVTFAVLTGLRRGEIFGLSWQDVDLPSAVITIRNPKKGETKRLPISEAVRELLVAQGERKSGRVFPWDTHNFINRVFIPSVRGAGIP